MSHSIQPRSPSTSSSSVNAQTAHLSTSSSNCCPVFSSLPSPSLRRLEGTESGWRCAPSVSGAATACKRMETATHILFPPKTHHPRSWTCRCDFLVAAVLADVDGKRTCAAASLSWTKTKRSCSFYTSRRDAFISLWQISGWLLAHLKKCAVVPWMDITLHGIKECPLIKKGKDLASYYRSPWATGSTHFFRTTSLFLRSMCLSINCNSSRSSVPLAFRIDPFNNLWTST